MIHLQRRADGVDPVLGRLSGGRTWQPAQYSCLNKSVDRGPGLTVPWNDPHQVGPAAGDRTTYSIYVNPSLSILLAFSLSERYRLAHPVSVSFMTDIYLFLNSHILIMSEEARKTQTGSIPKNVCVVSAGCRIFQAYLQHRGSVMPFFLFCYYFIVLVLENPDSTFRELYY